MHSQLTTRVEEFIAKCWQEGESRIVNGKKVKSRLKVSAEAVQPRLVVRGGTITTIRGLCYWSGETCVPPHWAK